MSGNLISKSMNPWKQKKLLFIIKIKKVQVVMPIWRYQNIKGEGNIVKKNAGTANQAAISKIDVHT